MATRGETVIVVETKTSLSLSLISQGMAWRMYAHAVYLVVPGGVDWSRRPAGEDVARALGLDIVRLRETTDKVYEWARGNNLSARFEYGTERVPTMVDRLRARLNDRQKDFSVAGNADGKYFTTFQATCECLAAWVKEHPGGTLTDAVAHIEHHYASPASARCALGKWIGEGKVKGVEWGPIKGTSKYGLFPIKVENVGMPKGEAR